MVFSQRFNWSNAFLHFNPNALHFTFTTLIAFFLVSCTVPLSGQVFFQKALIANGFRAYGNYATQLNDGRLVTSGYVDPLVSPLNWAAQIWFTDSEGEIATTFRTDSAGNDALDLYQQMAADLNGGFAAIYQTAGPGNNVGGLIRFGAQGNIIWERRNELSNVFYEDVIAVNDGYIVTVYSTLDPISAVQKYDFSGNLVWNRVLSVALDGGDIATDAVGNVYAVGRNAVGGCILKLTATGNLVWTKGFTTGEQTSLNHLAINNNQLAIAGATGNLSSDLILIRCNFDGVVQSSVTFTLDNEDLAPKGIALGSDNACIIAMSAADGESDFGAVLIKVRVNNSIEWKYDFSNLNNGTAVFNSLHALPDGYLLAGNYAKNTAVNALLVRTNAQGRVPGVCCADDVTLSVSNTSINSTDLNVGSNLTFGAALLDVNIETVINTAMSLCPTDQSNLIIGDADRTVCPGECVTISLANAASSGVNYEWSFPTGTPNSSTQPQPGEICFDIAGKVAITLKGNGCLLHDDTLTILSGADRFPNAFTPDATTNQIFRPIVICGAEDYHLEIFSRWGDLIFESFRYEEGWDGTANGEPAPPDTYIYRVEYYTSRDGQRILVGNEQREVLLLR
jgi:gliding motility-associated-like protein